MEKLTKKFTCLFKRIDNNFWISSDKIRSGKRVLIVFYMKLYVSKKNEPLKVVLTLNSQKFSFAFKLDFSVKIFYI